MSENPKVFISYAYDGQKHADKVLALSNQLRSQGIDSIIDQYIECPPEGWPRWMENQINTSQYVLMICTEAYFNRVMGKEKQGMGLGVQWEGNIIYQHIYNAGAKNTKFIPVLFNYSRLEHIPIPLQGTTRYNADVSEEYEKLYWRLRGFDRITKPELGKLRPLEEKEKKTDVGMFVTGFIDVDLWNNASWCGTIFMHDYNMIEPPFLGFLFSDEESAINIFKGWHKRFGNADDFNEMRLSIIEGDIPEKEPGYTVFVSANPDNIIKRAENNGINIPKDLFLIISRMHRMNPSKGSKNLDLFKKHFNRIGSCYLIPAVKCKDGSIKTFDKLRILKRNIVFRRAEDIKDRTDLDLPVIGKSIEEISR